MFFHARLYSSTRPLQQKSRVRFTKQAVHSLFYIYGNESKPVCSAKSLQARQQLLYWRTWWCCARHCPLENSWKGNQKLFRETKFLTSPKRGKQRTEISPTILNVLWKNWLWTRTSAMLCANGIYSWDTTSWWAKSNSMSKQSHCQTHSATDLIVRRTRKVSSIVDAMIPWEARVTSARYSLISWESLRRCRKKNTSTFNNFKWKPLTPGSTTSYFEEKGEKICRKLCQTPRKAIWPYGTKRLHQQWSWTQKRNERPGKRQCRNGDDIDIDAGAQQSCRVCVPDNRRCCSLCCDLDKIMNKALELHQATCCGQKELWAR